MAALRQQMIDAMVLRGLSPKTQEAYLRAVTRLAAFYGRSPDRISERGVLRMLRRAREPATALTASGDRGAEVGTRLREPSGSSACSSAAARGGRGPGTTRSRALAQGASTP